MSIRLESKKRNCDIYPSYKQIIGAKDKSRPKGLHITESVASVSLQNLLNHTAERIILLQKDVFNVYKDISGLTIIASYGFDGSTGQSLEATDTFDQSLFVTNTNSA